MRRRIRILLVEDSDVYRQSLLLVLRDYDDLEVVGALASGSSAASTCSELDVDVAVLDYRLPDVNGLEVANEVARRSPRTAIVFLSASAGAAEYDAARSTGAALVRKDGGVATLVDAVRAAAGRSEA